MQMIGHFGIKVLDIQLMPKYTVSFSFSIVSRIVSLVFTLRSLQMFAKKNKNGSNIMNFMHWQEKTQDKTQQGCNC